MTWFLSRIYCSLFDYDLMANTLEKAFLILAVNLNSSRNYLITSVFHVDVNCELNFLDFAEVGSSTVTVLS